MTPREAVFTLIWVAVIAALAFAFEYFARKAVEPKPLPQIVRFLIWGVAALLVLLLLLGFFDGGGLSLLDETP